MSQILANQEEYYFVSFHCAIFNRIFVSSQEFYV